MTATGSTAGVFADPDVFAAAHCVGHHDLFDPPGEGEVASAATERHGRAQALCDGCPCLAACAALADTLPRGVRRGVWAGQVPDPGRAEQ